eukprot:6204723-Pleurochrysis_carterae.AAC.2
MPVATGYSGSQEGHQSDGVAGPATRTAASHVGSMTERSENALLKKELEWTRERLETVTGELQSTRSRLEAELGEAKETIASLRLELQQTRIRADRSLSDKEHTPSVKSAGSETSRIIIAGGCLQTVASMLVLAQHACDTRSRASPRHSLPRGS